MYLECFNRLIYFLRHKHQKASFSKSTLKIYYQRSKKSEIFKILTNQNMAHICKKYIIKTCDSCVFLKLFFSKRLINVNSKYVDLQSCFRHQILDTHLLGIRTITIFCRYFTIQKKNPTLFDGYVEFVVGKTSLIELPDFDIKF